MNVREGLGRAVVAIVAVVLVGGAVTTVTPAGAEMSQFASTNWKKIWKKQLVPLADKRYYNKAQADVKYQPLGDYAAAGSSYTKAESDARYAPEQPLYRGSLMFGGSPTGASQTFYGSISFGATFSEVPTGHYIKVGDVIPAGCSGSAAEPNAAPGHLCIFETEAAVAPGTRGICAGGGNTCSRADAFGAGVFVKSTAAGVIEILATWAARPTAVVNTSFVALKGTHRNVADADRAPASSR